KFIEKSDKNDSGDVGLSEFVQYVREHEKNLRLQFSHLDKNKDGKVDLEEMIQSFKDLGIKMERTEAIKLFNRFVHKKFLFRKFFNENTDLNFRMDSDGSLNISFDEWRDFLLLADSSNIHDLISYWRHST
ncbi:unnamed protein product, partial [Diamesa tonsa]